MKRILKLKKLILLSLIGGGIMLLHGCVVYNPDYMSSVPVSDIVQMSKNGLSSKEIIKQMRSTHSVYMLKAAQLAALKSEGVQDSVINYMQATHLRAIRQDQRRADYYNNWPGMYGYGYWGPGFWGPYGYWGYDFGPSVIIRGGGGFHRGGGEIHEHEHGGDRK